MKIRNNLVHIGLLIVVLLSLFLSAIIWIDPATLHHTTTTQTTTSTSNSTKYYNWSDVYLPTNIIVNINKHQKQLMSNQIDIVKKMYNSLDSINVKSVELKHYHNYNNYYNNMTSINGILLSYSGSISIGILSKIFQNKSILSKYLNKPIQHVELSLNNHKLLYLFDDNNLDMYKINLNKVISDKVYDIIYNEKVRRIPVQYKMIFKNKYILEYPNSINIPEYSYLVNKDNVNSLLESILGTYTYGTIGTHEYKNITTYSIGDNEHLSVNHNTGLINYESCEKENYNKNLTFNELLKGTFNELNRMNVVLNNVRYSYYDSKRQTVVYQSYVNNLPILSKNDYGIYKMSFQRNGIIQYTFSIYNLQIPVSNNRSIQLPSTTQVLQKLKDDNYHINKIQNIEIGYSWNSNPNSQMIVTLIPTYFIKYNNSWINYKMM